MNQAKSLILFRLAAIVLVLVACSPLAPSAGLPTPTPAFKAAVDAAPASPAIDLQDCLLGDIPARCGVVTVFENRQAGTGRTIDIHVAVIPATDPNPAPDPIFYLAGGPGASGIDDAAYARLVLKSAIRQRDLVLFDQRGTGRSNQMVCPRDLTESGGMAPFDEAMSQGLRDCLAHLEGDPAAYTTAWGMDDLDDVRQALGYDQINLYGESYGTTAEQVYLQRHGEHVRSMALEGVSLLDVPMFERMPRSSQAALDLLLARCQADPVCNPMYPNLGSEIAEVIARVEAQPVELPVRNPATGEPVRYNREALVLGLHQALLLTPATAKLPYLIHRAYQGDWSWAAQGGALPSTAEWKIMNLTILCHEDWAGTRRAETDRLSQGSYLTYEDVRRYLAPEAVCALMPHPQPEALYEPLTPTSTPVLILSNQADPQNPPENVAGADEHYPNSLTLVAPGQGHGYTGFACRDQILADFIDHGSVHGLYSDCLQYEPLPALQ